MSGALDAPPSGNAAQTQTGQQQQKQQQPTQHHSNTLPVQVHNYPPAGRSTTDKDLEHGIPPGSQIFSLQPSARAAVPPSLTTSRSQSSLRDQGTTTGPDTVRPDSSHVSAASHTGSVGPGDGVADAEEYAWGPSHPCFPHLNPHVPLSSHLYSTTRVIRIKRDWMVAGDLAPTFSNLYPEILDPSLPEAEFRMIIRTLNERLIDAFNPYSVWNALDGIVSFLTFWLWDDLGFARVKRKLAALEGWIENWNRNVGEKEGVRIIPLRRTGYLSLDIQIPDPHIGLAASEAPSRPTTGRSSSPGASQAHPNGQDQQSLNRNGSTNQAQYQYSNTGPPSQYTYPDYHTPSLSVAS